MAEEKETPTTEEPEAVEEPKEEPDPYAEYDESQRDTIREYNERLNKMNAYERAVVLEMAAEFKKMQETKEREPKPEPEKPTKTTKKAKRADPDDDEPDPVSMLAAEVKSLREELESEKRTKAQQAQVKEFNEKLDSVLSENTDVEDEDVREFLKDGFLGHYLKHKPGDVKGSFKRWLERHKKSVEKAAEKKQQEYVKGKLSTGFRTRGETGPSNSPAREESKVTAEDFQSGALADRLKEELGLV